MNNVALTGRFTRDPEIKYAESGTSIARFTLAVDRRFKQDDGPTADFIRCIAFGKTAEFIEKYFTKGMKIELSGRIQTGSYTNKDGITVYTTDVVADQVGFAESKAASGQTSGGARSEVGHDLAADGFMSIPDGINDEELPF